MCLLNRKMYGYVCAIRVSIYSLLSTYFSLSDNTPNITLFATYPGIHSFFFVFCWLVYMACWVHVEYYALCAIMSSILHTKIHNVKPLLHYTFKLPFRMKSAFHPICLLADGSVDRLTLFTREYEVKWCADGSQAVRQSSRQAGKNMYEASAGAPRRAAPGWVLLNYDWRCIVGK